MAGQRLRQLWVDAAAGKIRDERVAKRVEINNVVLGVPILNARGRKIDAEDARKLLPSRHAEQRLVQFSLHQVFIQGRCGRWPEWERVIAAMLGVRRHHLDGRNLAAKVKRTRSQAANLASPKTGFNGEAIEHGTIKAGHSPGYDAIAIAAIQRFTVLSGLDEAMQLILRERSPNEAPVCLDVERIEMGNR